ncbi:MAG: class I adenylate-forming enzyme family protein [Methylocystaceae bacterium]
MSRTDGAKRLLSDYLQQAAALYPDKVAMISGDNRVTYREFNDKARQLALYLLSAGVKHGDRIAYIFPPRPEFFYLYIAAAQIGAIIVGMSTRHTPNEMEYLLLNSEADMIITVASMYDIDYQERLGQILSNCPRVRQVVVVDGSPTLDLAVSFDSVMAGDYSAYADELKTREDAVSTHDGLIIVYTSGSTGQPKGAVMTHENIIHTALIEVTEAGITPDDVWLCHLPVNHISGANEVGASVIVSNSTMILEPFNPIRVMELIQKEKVTFLGQVPTMYAMEFALPNFADYDLSSVKVAVISGAPAPREMLAKIQSSICPEVRNCLGLTECSGLVAYTPLGSDLSLLNETVGRIAPEIEIKIVDKNRQPLPVGEAGEIAYRGTVVIKEYYRMPEKTAADIDQDGWFYSGDVAFLDLDGNIHLVGRAKEMYITGGFNVYPAEVEEYINRFPGVMLAACVAVPHPIQGEVGRAYIVPQPGVTIDTKELPQFLAQYLADYKIPREYVIRDMLPMTLLGKIEKKLLRQEVEAEIAKN